MKPYQAVGWSMINASAITALVTTTNIVHGLRPKNSSVPSINFFELPGTRRWIESQPYTINCRANTAGLSQDIQREVVKLFNGSAQTGVYGTQNGFDFSRASAGETMGLLSEPGDEIFNSPVVVTIVYPSSTVS